jgi:hypothetical protein
MDLNFDITILGVAVLAIAAGLFALVLAFLWTDSPSVSGWLLTGVGAFVGAFVASEYLGADAVGPVWEGVAWVPALIAGAIVGGAVEVVSRYLRGGRTTHGAHI